MKFAKEPDVLPPLSIAVVCVVDKWQQPPSSQGCFSEVQIRGERPSLAGAVGRSLLGQQMFKPPISVAEHGQGCVLHHIVHR